MWPYCKDKAQEVRVAKCPNCGGPSTGCYNDEFEMFLLVMSAECKAETQQYCSMKGRKIEEGVQLPEVNSKTKYPWPKMEVDHCDFIEADKGRIPTALKLRAGSAAAYCGIGAVKKFKT